ncbi:MAG: DUF3772 domain-containing protein [Methylocystis sp.]|nr:DUF3772 domain-containing protein [Methylocystis sp.]
MLRNKLIRLIICFSACFAAAAFASQTPTEIDHFNARLDRARGAVDEIAAELNKPSITGGILKRLRDKIDPIAGDLQDIVDQLEPRLNSIKARLDELGSPAARAAPPADGKPPEAKPSPPASAPSKAAPGSAQTQSRGAKTPPGVPSGAGVAPAPAIDQGAAEARADAEWAEQKKLFDATDATLKRARSLLIEVRQTAASIVAQQRGLFAKTLFLRTNGVLSPSLWNSALRELPADFALLRMVLGEGWAKAAARLEDGQLAAFLALAGLILGYVAPAAFMARRVLARGETMAGPGRLRKALKAAWTAIVIAAIPIAVIGALALLIDAFDLVDASLEPLQRTLVEAVARIALVTALARGLLAPTRAPWRLIDVGGQFAGKLARLALGVAVIVSMTRILEQLEEIAQAGLPAAVVTRGVGALFAAILLGAVLLVPRCASADNDACLGPKVVSTRDWWGPLHLLGWLVIAAIVGGCVAGYVSFAAFVINQIGWITAVGAMLYLLLTLGGLGLEKALDPAAAPGRLLMTGLGVKRESLGQFAVLLTGLMTLAGYTIAAVLVLAPLGFESDDFAGRLRSVFFGFKIGDVTISLSSVVIALVLFAGVLAATRTLQRWFDQRYLPLTRLDLGLRNSIRTSLGYAGFILAISLSLAYLGLSFDRLAIVAGALSVGIGFGLQSIVNNFVSGLILLWERAIRVGDWVVVGDEQGYVKRINVRSTEIETFDRATMIVPNSNLVAGVVKNWLRGDKVGRIKIALTPHAGVDPEKMRDILLAVAKAQDGVLHIPAPQVMFVAMEASAFRFELWCFVEDVEQASRVRSDLHFDLHQRLAAEGVTIAAPLVTPAPAIVHLSGLEKFVTAGRDSDDGGRRKRE